MINSDENKVQADKNKAPLAEDQNGLQDYLSF
jgi:hypothetical protein